MTVSFCYLMIPLDIIEIVMDELASTKDMGSLRASSLVCRAFLSICRKHIFSSIELRQVYRAKEQPIYRFRRMLDRNPSIAGCVRTFNYTNNLYTKHGPPVLRRLRRVHDFTFGYTDGEMLMATQKDWKKIPHPFRSALCSFIQSNDIVELHLFNILNLPMTIFMHFPQLTRLDLFNVNVADSPVPKTFRKPKTTPKLKTLWVRLGCLDAMQKIFSSERDHLVPILDLSGLEQLSVLTEENEGMYTITRLLRFSNSLKSLTCSGSYPDLNCLNNIAKNITPESMKTLKIVQMYPMLEAQDIDPYVYFTHELEQMADKNVMEQLTFEIDIETDERCTVNHAEWSQLDVVLSKGGFPLLRRVEIKIVIWYFCNNYDEFQAQLEDIGEKCFPWLKENKTVEFHFSVRVEWV